MIKQLWQKMFKSKAAPKEVEPPLALVPIEPEPEEVVEEIVEKKALSREAKIEKEEVPQEVDPAANEMPIHPCLKEVVQSKRSCPSCGSALRIRSERRTYGEASVSFYVCSDHPNCRYRFPLTNV